MKAVYDEVAQRCSVLTTRSYSTSFSLGIRFLAPELRPGVYAVYGFVRFADEIVDTFHEYDKEALLDTFERDTWRAIDQGISLNPILHSFQWAVHRYCIDHECIRTFLHSMRMDLSKQSYSREEYERYILGSAEVVGLMCLSIFVQGRPESYRELKDPAMRLGAAFQKINFLRDVRADFNQLGRTYFPGVEMEHFDEAAKKRIEREIELDFQAGYEGIRKLPKSARLGVYVAYVYYIKLFSKIKAKRTEDILKERVRISNKRKVALFFSSYVRHSLNQL